MRNVLIYGNCLAAMVGALELVKNNNKVTLVNASDHWGGHFSPFLFDTTTKSVIFFISLTSILNPFSE